MCAVTRAGEHALSHVCPWILAFCEGRHSAPAGRFQWVQREASNRSRTRESDSCVSGGYVPALKVK